MRALARAHIDAEAQRFTPAELADIEARYRMAHARGLPMLTGPEAVAILEPLIERYPLSNRAGCAALEVARAAPADTRERLLEEVIAKHGDAWFENGVQVGAAARASLATHLAGLDRYDEAERIAVEMVQRFPGAIDETGASSTICRGASTCCASRNASRRASPRRSAGGCAPSCAARSCRWGPWLECRCVPSKSET